MKRGHKTSYLPHFGLAAVLLVVAATLQADRDAERGALGRLVAEIQRLEPLIARAEAESESNARVSFRYDWLRRDLNQVQRGIEAYIDDTAFTPRKFEALQGDYHQ